MTPIVAPQPATEPTRMVRGSGHRQRYRQADTDGICLPVRQTQLPSQPTPGTPRQDYAYTSAIDLAKAIASKQVSAVEVMRACLDRQSALEPKLNCFVTTTPAAALEAARRAEQAVMAGEPLGALHGLPISVKDLIALGGVRQTFGSRTMAQNIAAADAPSVERNVAAGACIIGKTTTTEFGCRGGGPSPLTGITRTDPIDWWMAEFYAVVGTRLKFTMRESRQLLDPAVALMLEPALKQSLEDCYDEVFRRYEYRERMRARFENIDLLITPATPCSAFGADEDSPAGFGENIISWMH